MEADSLRIYTIFMCIFRPMCKKGRFSGIIKIGVVEPKQTIVYILDNTFVRRQPQRRTGYDKDMGQTKKWWFANSNFSPYQAYSLP